jgi:hypothetical protein
MSPSNSDPRRRVSGLELVDRRRAPVLTLWPWRTFTSTHGPSRHITPPRDLDCFQITADISREQNRAGRCKNGSNIKFGRACRICIASGDMSATDCSRARQQAIRERLGLHWLGIAQIDCLRAVMLVEKLTADQCDELAKALREDAARLPHGSERSPCYSWRRTTASSPG